MHTVLSRGGERRRNRAPLEFAALDFQIAPREIIRLSFPGHLTGTQNMTYARLPSFAIEK